MATATMAVLVSISVSTSLARRRLRPSHAKVRSITDERPAGLSSDSRRERGQETAEASRQQVEPLGVARPLDDLEAEPFLRGGTGGLIALIAAVGEDQFQPREAAPDSVADLGKAFSILDVGGVNHQHERQAV